MKLYIQDQVTGELLFCTEDTCAIPCVGEQISVNGIYPEWYTVIERNFYFKHLKNIDDNSCTCWVAPIKEK